MTMTSFAPFQSGIAVRLNSIGKIGAAKPQVGISYRIAEKMSIGSFLILLSDFFLQIGISAYAELSQRSRGEASADQI